MYPSYHCSGVDRILGGGKNFCMEKFRIFGWIWDFFLKKPWQIKEILDRGGCGFPPNYPPPGYATVSLQIVNY